MSDTIKIEYSIRTSKQGSECGDIVEMDRAEWDAMNENEREEIMRDAAFNHVEWCFWEKSQNTTEADHERD